MGITLGAGSTIGILGGGQLGRFIAEAARPLGLKTIVLDPVADCPAAKAADRFIQAGMTEVPAFLELASASDVVTLEWELIPAEVLEQVAAVKPLRPGAEELRIIQDRLTQKEFLAKRGFPQARYEAIDAAGGLRPAARGILKRRRHGYDGKGQARLPEDFARAAEVLAAPCVLEERVDFARELSVILARGLDGEVRFFPLAENLHRNGILHATIAPAPAPPGLERAAMTLARGVAEAFGHVGVMAVELFETQSGELLVNEVAPRVHNSGHFTLGACRTSQFEQHVRAVCGLPLGDPAQEKPAVMVNLLGELWAKGEPRWDILRACPQARLHLYGKVKAAPGRKMGHITISGESASLANAERLLRDLSP